MAYPGDTSRFGDAELADLGRSRTMRRSLALIWLGLVAAAPTRGQFEPLDESFPHDPEHPAAGLWVGDLSVGPTAQFGVLAIERDGGGTWSAKGTAAFLLERRRRGGSGDITAPRS